MIIYSKNYFGLSLIFRAHGSAVARAVPQTLLSVFIYLLMEAYDPIKSLSAQGEGLEFYDHPYAVGVLVTSCTFLITFRANFAYQRYWEASGTVHQMMSKWMDAATQSASFHMQSTMYDRVKPPSFNDHPNMTTTPYSGIHKRHSQKSMSEDPTITVLSINDFPTDLKLDIFNPRAFRTLRKKSSFIAPPQAFADNEKFGPGHMSLRVSSEFTDEPSPFLQELVHKFSLMNAVALATLRNDIDGAPSPLTGYTPGSPWPEVDPVKIPNAEKAYSNGAFSDFLLYILGIDRTTLARTQYNASRPLGVYGGVSDAEIKQLQAARGPSAKVNLCFMWLNEFVVREHLAGSLGNVGPPIISRLFQFLSDGMTGYNQARKIMWIPFPFPHAQIAVFFSWISMLCVPLLLLQYANNKWMGASITFFTVLSLTGMHEVSKELENPFRNTPNDLPLCTMQAHFNEAMMTMFVGYHPDSWWASPPLLHKKSDSDNTEEIQDDDTAVEVSSSGDDNV
mmetsp:Transcript_10859/g.21533  ORF Transcript_10859/g.21533 Transcript_10859/m.21533 type:complete len:507 (+) Transcript_10859:238-1758(+)